MSTYSSGGYISYPKFGTILEEVKVTSNKPKNSTRALFCMLMRKPRNKSTIQKTLWLINHGLQNINGNHKGYMCSTIAWHTREGRLERTKVGRETFFSLTAKGIAYAQERGIF